MDNSETLPDITQIRAVLRRIVSEVIGTELSESDDEVYLLDIVTSSLALVEGMRRVFEHFGVLVSFRHIIEGEATLRALAVYIDQALTSHSNDGQQAARKAGRGSAQAARREIPVAPPLQHVAFLTRYSPGASSAFNEPLLVRLEGFLDGPALQAAVETVGERYDSLRTALGRDADTLDISHGAPVPLTVSPCAPDQLEQRISEMAGRPFEAGDVLFRAELLRLAATDHVLALIGHNLVLDQQALLLVLQEMAAFYHAASRNALFDAGSPAMQWVEFHARREADSSDQKQAEARKYWQELFAHEIPRLNLPTDFPRPAIKQYAGRRLEVPLATSLEARLRRWAKREGVTTPDALFSAFTALLHRLTGQKEIMVGIGSGPLFLAAGESAVARTEEMIPVRSEFDPGQTFGDHARAAAAALAAARAHGRLSLSELIQMLDVPRDQSRSPLFSAAFRAHMAGALPEFGTPRAHLITAPSTGSRYDVELIVSSAGDRLRLICDYSSELFEAASISRWLHGLLRFLEVGMESRDQPCGQLPVISEAEQQRLLVEWNATERPYPEERTILDLIEERIQSGPERPAIRVGDDRLSFGQLGERIAELSGLLGERGVSPGDRVGILLPRTLDLIPALLAVWRAGALYVPLDASFPRERIGYMLADAEVNLVITARRLLPLLEGQSDCEPLCLDDGSGLVAPAMNEMAPAKSSDSAYIIYTSGSTGQPKGVEIAHRGLVNFMLSTQEMLDFSSDDALLALTTISFDISGAELFMPLIAGGTVVLAEEGLGADGLGLAERIAQQRPAYIQATPSTWKALLTAGWPGDPDLCAISTGEALSRELAEALLARVAAVWNLYGPTETTIFSAASRVTSEPEAPVRIGRPYPNTQLYILDERLQPVPVGAIGELFIGGVGLARGYWKKPDLTESRFIPNPFNPATRLYRSGDLARFLPDGELLWLGRIDHQVKIHGVRVELGEVESVLRSVPGIRDAVVTSWIGSHGDAQLVAHLMVEGKNPPSRLAIRARLRERLPEVMIPPYLMLTDAFPLTANGKVHRASLPEPERSQAVPWSGAAVAATPTEKLLAELWARILEIDAGEIGRDHDFMDLGGHSLLITPLMLEVRKLFSVSFNMRDFFAASTVRKFAAMIDKRRRARSSQNNGREPSRPLRDAEWGRQRMAFLRREAQLPPNIAPARGMVYQPRQETRKVLLTGATGFLGVYLAAEILKATNARLFCLVRPKRGESGRKRIESQMRHYDVWRDDEEWLSAWRERLHVVEGDVTLPRLGILDGNYETLAREVDCVIHSAAHVNFIYPYEALRATNVLGIHEVMRFAFLGRIKPVHYLSTAAIWPMGSGQTFLERDTIEHGRLLNLGYDESKWVGEQCLLNAAERGLPVARYRPGEVGGDSTTGRCVIDHFLLAAVKGFIQFGAFPALDMYVDVAPVDYVASAVVHLAFRRNPLGRAFHLTNPRRSHMSDALSFLRELGYRFEEMRFETLRDRLITRDDFAQNALFPYQAILQEMDDVSLQLPDYDARETERELEGSGIVCPPADEKLFGTYMGYLRAAGFMPEPANRSIREGSYAT